MIHRKHMIFFLDVYDEAWIGEYLKAARMSLIWAPPA